MSLTKAQTKDLRGILDSLSWASAFVFSPDVRVCRTTRPEHTNALTFTRAPVPEILLTAESRGPHYALDELARDLGSPLCGLHTSRQALQQFLATHGYVTLTKEGAP